MGAWPDLTEYHEAVQHRQRLLPPGLKSGHPRARSVRLPKPARRQRRVTRPSEPGGFLEIQEDLGKFAASCARSATMPNVMRRSPNSSQVRLPYDVNFQFLSGAFKFDPIGSLSSKMQWAKGDLLHSHVEKASRLSSHSRDCGQNG